MKMVLIILALVYSFNTLSANDLLDTNKVILVSLGTGDTILSLNRIETGIENDVEIILKKNDTDIFRELNKIISHISSLGINCRYNIDLLQVLEQIDSNNNIAVLFIKNFSGKELPHINKYFKNLTWLNLELLSNVDNTNQAIKGINKLIRFDISSPYLQTLPDELFNNENLQYMYITLPKLAKLPNNIEKLHNLSRLEINYGDSLLLPSTINHLELLRDITFRNMNSIDLSRNIEIMSKIPNLEGFYVDNCNVKEIPDNIGSLKRLRMLSLIFNHIEEINTNIYKLKKLESMYLSGNPIEGIDEGICELEYLITLDLQNTRVSNLPECLANMNNLYAVYLTSTDNNRAKMERMKKLFPKLIIYPDTNSQNKN